MTEVDQRAIGRRKVIAALSTGAVVLGAAVLPTQASAKPARWRPVFEKDDDWMALPSRHRLVFDATSADGVAHALFFARRPESATGATFRSSATGKVRILFRPGLESAHRA